MAVPLLSMQIPQKLGFDLGKYHRDELGGLSREALGGLMGCGRGRVCGHRRDKKEKIIK